MPFIKSSLNAQRSNTICTPLKPRRTGAPIKTLEKANSYQSACLGVDRFGRVPETGQNPDFRYILQKMTVSDLRNWLFQNGLEDQWWLSLEGVLEENPMSLSEVEAHISTSNFADIKVSHVSHSSQQNPPWVDIDRPPPPQTQSYSPQAKELIILGHSSFPAAHSQSTGPPTSRVAYVLLGLFLGFFGIHNFYAGYSGKGITQLLITILIGWLMIPLFAVAIWTLVEICTVSRDANNRPMS